MGAGCVTGVGDGGRRSVGAGGLVCRGVMRAVFTPHPRKGRPPHRRAASHPVSQGREGRPTSADLTDKCDHARTSLRSSQWPCVGTGPPTLELLTAAGTVTGAALVPNLDEPGSPPSHLLAPLSRLGGPISLYSANVVTPFGMVAETGLATDGCDVPHVLWGVAGDFVLNSKDPGERFDMTDHCVRCRVLDRSVGAGYVKAALARAAVRGDLGPRHPPPWPASVHSGRQILGTELVGRGELR